jgi:HK97 family phage prohead protease
MNEFTIEWRGETSDDGRTITGIAVPYNDTISVGGFKERFERGAIENIEETKLFYGHNEPIGKVVRGEDTEDGFLIEARISDTSTGNEVRTLLQDGVLNKFSVGFEPIEDERDEDGVVVRKKVRLREVSVVAFPAYDNASVLSVRESEDSVADNKDFEERKEESEMENTNEIAELRSAIEEMDRKIAVGTEVAPSATVPQFRSFGDYVYGVATNDDNALDFAHRVYTGSVIADSISDNVWVSEVVRLVERGRPTLNAFRTSALPASGMNVEYPMVGTDTSAVAEQAAEGDTLTFGKIDLTSQTAPVKTYGGWSSMSRQVIERSSIGYVDVAFRAMALAYAKATNAAAIAALAGATGTGTADGTAAGWYTAIADAALALNDDHGLAPEFILVSGDVYKDIAILFDSTDRPIVGGNFNGVGTSNVVALTASIGGLPVIVDPALVAGSCYIANSEAMVTYESSNAPLRLTADNITELTRDFSVYGYAAMAMPMPSAIVKVTVA